MGSMALTVTKVLSFPVLNFIFQKYYYTSNTWRIHTFMSLNDVLNVPAVIS